MNRSNLFVDYPSDREIVLTSAFDAPRSMLFKEWTDPKHLSRWWGPSSVAIPVCEMDLRPGGAYRIDMLSPNSVEYPLKGVFLEIREPEHLVVTQDFSEHPQEWHDFLKPDRGKEGANPAGIICLTVDFEDLGGRTKLAVRTRFNSPKIRDAFLKMGMIDGWSQSLDKLAGRLANGARPALEPQMRE